MLKTCSELTSGDGVFFRFQLLNKPRSVFPGACVFTTIKKQSLFSIFSLIEFEIQDILHFDVDDVLLYIAPKHHRKQPGGFDLFCNICVCLNGLL